MKKKIMEKWVEALRSGEFKQGRAYLANDGKHCCLGVLCELALVEGVCDHDTAPFVFEVKYHETFDGKFKTLPSSVMKWAGMVSPSGDIPVAYGQSLAGLNDIGTRFKTIANIIEKNWKKL